jgi:hypothetical protein
MSRSCYDLDPLPPAMTTTNSRLRAAFAEAERRGLLLTTRLRLVIMAVLELWLPVENA